MYLLDRMPEEVLTTAQQELYDWLVDFITNHHHSPSIRQMMQAMGLKSPAPIQSRLRHLQEKGWIKWQEGQARTLQLIEESLSGVPVMGSIAAGGLVETFDDVQDTLDFDSVLKLKGLFALTVNGDSMIDSFIADGDMVLMEPVNDPSRLRNGTIVSAMVPGLGTTLKHFFRDKNLIRLEAANPAYEPIEIEAEQVHIQGKLAAVWRKT